MRRIFVYLSTLALTFFSMISCEKNQTVDYYMYDLSFYVTTSDFKEISNALEARLNVLYEFTEDQAKAEWNSFYDSIDESKLVIAEGDYYDVKLNRMKEEGDRLVPVEAIGEYIWE